MFHVAHKLKEGRSLLDSPTIPLSKQDAALSHFVGFFGESYYKIMQKKLGNAVSEYKSGISDVSQCTQRIKDEFMVAITKKFTLKENISHDVILDRQLFLIYTADLMASYILMFTGKGISHNLYKYIWSNWAFLDGNIDWLCCNWVLNCGNHDEDAHKNGTALDSIPNDELIDIIRLHKHHLSPDFVRQRSRNVLKTLDKASLLAIFQSIMIKALWGHSITPEDGSNSSEVEGKDSSIHPENDKRMTEKDQISSLHKWLKEYRKKKAQRTNVLLPRLSELKFHESESARNSKKYIGIIKTKINYIDIELNKMSENMHEHDADYSELNTTLYKTKGMLNTLLNVYESELVENSLVYGYINNNNGLNVMKSLLNAFDTSELLNLLSAVLLAIPELKPVITRQDYADYAIIPFNTLAKLCFIGIMRINPNISFSPSDTQHEENTESRRTDSVKPSSMVFEPYELKGVVKKSAKMLKMNLKIGGKEKKCLILTAERDRNITEGILSHISSYEALCKVLDNPDLEQIDSIDSKTAEAIRQTKISSIFKKMDDEQLNGTYIKVLKEIELNPKPFVQEETFEVQHSSFVNDIKTLFEENPEIDALELSKFYTENNTDSQYSVESERNGILRFLEGEDLDSLIDDSFSTRSVHEMSLSELRMLSEKVSNRIENDPNTDIITLNPYSDHKFTLTSLPTRKRTCINKAFRLFAKLGDYYTAEATENTYKNFFKRDNSNLEPTWQDPQLIENFIRPTHRVNTINVEKYLNKWLDLGLGTDVANAAVAWIKKSILDVVGREYDDLEIEPTQIQNMAIPTLLKDSSNLLIASNAASGKTLAYLLPIIQLLKNEEKKFLRKLRSPRALILVPNRELADQILSVIKGLGHVAKITCESLTGGYLMRKQRKHVNRLVDIVVATPDRLYKMNKYIDMSRIKFIVLDEANVLINEGFWPRAHQILDNLRHDPQLILVAPDYKFLDHFKRVQTSISRKGKHNISTIGCKIKGRDELNRRIEEYYGNSYENTIRGFSLCEEIFNCKKIVDEAWVHRPGRGVTHEFINVKSDDKVRALINLIRYGSARRCKKILVFCNTLQSCRAVHHYLVEAGLPATCLHGKVPILQRRKNYRDFINNAYGILVTTDVFSAGLDLNVDAAIMFDFPLNSMDYLRRSGRVGRLINNDAIAPKGISISLLKKRDLPLATAIQRSIKMPFFPLNNLSSRKSDYNIRTGRMRYLTQAGSYFKLAEILRREEIEGTFKYENMNSYLEKFRGAVKEQSKNSLKKIILRRRRICKRRRILLRRLKLMKRWNKAVRLKQRIISQIDKRVRKSDGSIHTRMNKENRKCPSLKDLKPIRGKLMKLKLIADKLNERILKRNDNALMKFINKVQLKAKDASIKEKDTKPKFHTIDKVKASIGKSVKRICSLV
ncbi:DEAD box ATP-dependent RNA helicase family member protein [Theileria equi strain WA]|uniref:DEAD box ATP-dependent RNA helicase family member protein n=1 Tax=Theileria equi strain WA TaxID=1537102 RepID=L1LD17_THEEQ|nr:DEAD box ATP-dependent RNA helicase family member protein [Theileria equi strain WA]EKX73145.1 DEAD box ATP-dependent RNA helicase family member protein [Theileria equi strain WA]|eukprot:XP_004832597.1 DEAD box ATP-dependent RNA helicase family member protein [Theileria equi strain WA]